MTQGTDAPLSLRGRLRHWLRQAHSFQGEAGQGPANGLSSWSAHGVGGSVEGQSRVEEMERDRVLIGELPAQGLARAVQGYTDVRIDDLGSAAGSPFSRRGLALSCQAYEALVMAAMEMDNGEAWGLTSSGQGSILRVEATAFEGELLSAIATSFGVELIASAHRFSASSLCVWLWHHARILSSGQSLRLLCRCCSDGLSAPAYSCHAQTLAVVLRRLAALSHGHEPALAALALPTTIHATTGLTVRARSLESSLWRLAALRTMLMLAW